MCEAQLDIKYGKKLRGVFTPPPYGGYKNITGQGWELGRMSFMDRTECGKI